MATLTARPPRKRQTRTYNAGIARTVPVQPHPTHVLSGPAALAAALTMQTPRESVVIVAPGADQVRCARCSDPMPADHVGDCFGCVSHDRSEAKRIARERAIAAYGEGRC